MTPFTRGLLRPALNTMVAATLAVLVVLGSHASEAASTPLHPSQAYAATPDITLAAAAVTSTRKHHWTAAALRKRGARVLRVAKAQTGDRYAYGASGPSAFDCSGLTAYVYRIAAHRHLPHNASAQQGSTRRISASSARPGDLVFFHDGGGVYHVAIYAGGHTVIHAPYPGQRVKRERIWTSAVTYGRVV